MLVNSAAVIGIGVLIFPVLKRHHEISAYGYLSAQLRDCLGLWLVPLGYLAYTSGMFPRTLGVLLVAGGACYLVGTLAAFLIPGSGQTINTVITIPSAIAEVCMVIYLLVIGVKTVEPDDLHRSPPLQPIKTP